MIGAISCTLIAVSLLVLIRNSLTFKWQMRRLKYIHETNLARIATDCKELLDYRADSVAYDTMLLDLFKWSYKSFFPKEPS